jgi:hypothetical protein
MTMRMVVAGDGSERGKGGGCRAGLGSHRSPVPAGRRGVPARP